MTAQKGDKLSAVALTSFTNNPPGKFTWVKPATTLNASGDHDMNFIPDDPDTYNTVKKAVNVTVVQQEVEIEMVRIPAGTFSMGRATTPNSTYNDSPVHQVTLTKAFYIGKYEITQEQYEAVMGENPSGFTSDPDPGEKQERRPVEKVNWFDAIIFCNKLSMAQGLKPAYSGIGGTTDPSTWGAVPENETDNPGELGQWNAIYVIDNTDGYRLPTEAQWEYACRNGTTTLYYFSAPGTLPANETYNTNMGWYGGASNIVNSNTKTHEVGLKYSNAPGIMGGGLYDMYGNVKEWCWDWAAAYANPAEAQTDPTGPSTPPNVLRRITRGGSFRYSPVNGNNQVNVNSVARDGGSGPWLRNDSTGFRVVRPVE